MGVGAIAGDAGKGAAIGATTGALAGGARQGRQQQAANQQAQSQQQALIAGRIDVFVHDAPIVLMMAAEHQTEGIKPLPIMLNEEYLAWELRKSDTELITTVNAFIDQAKQEGTLKETVKHWIPLAQ